MKKTLGLLAPALCWSCLVDGAGDIYWTDDSDRPPVAAARPQVAVAAGRTENAERIEKLPIGRRASTARRRIALRLGPADLPRLAPGDVLATPAEVQVTTRCDVGQSAAGCDYNPKVRAQIILTGRAGDKSAAGAGSAALSEPITLSCTKAEHHCRFVFRPSDTIHSLTGRFDLPCVADSSCFVNLVMWAWHPDARAGEKDAVIVGENEGDFLANGEVGGDKARLMAIRERAFPAAERRRRMTSGGGDLRVPTNGDATLVYSLALGGGGRGLVRGEQYAVEAKIVTAVSSRASFSTKMYVTRDRNSTGGGSFGAITPAQISEHNGINCTAGTSPCTARRVAVFRVTKDVPGPVYVNVYAKSAVPGGGSARVVVERNRGWLRSTRYRSIYR